MGHWSAVMQTIKNANVVIFILDARMPEISRNEGLEDKLKESRKEVLIVFNKIDLIPLTKLRKLQKENKGCFFVSSQNRAGINRLRLKLQILTKSLKTEELKVGIVGYPNVGKSALANVLARAAKAKVSSRAGTTKGLQWIKGAKIKILDSPGVIPFNDDEVKLGMLGAKNPEKIIPKLNIKTQVNKKDIQWYLDLPNFITKSKERLKKETKIHSNKKCDKEM